jgi:hypothetical protein
MLSCEDYISGITFRSIKPGKLGIQILHQLLSRCFKGFEIKNTILPEDEPRMKERLREISKIPKLSSFAVGAVINRAVTQMKKNQVYLNIGVWQGFTLLAGMMENEDKTCIGVDNFIEDPRGEKAFLKRFKKYKSANHYFYKEDFVDYFKNRHNSSIGVYMYDAGHDFWIQLMGLELAAPFFEKGTIIIVDDTNWEIPRIATNHFLSGRPGEYRVLLDVKTASDSHVTFWCGLMVLQKTK